MNITAMHVWSAVAIQHSLSPSAAAAAAAVLLYLPHHHPPLPHTLLCSYHDIMLAPIADALRDSLAAAAKGGFLRTLPGRKRPLVYFAMQVRMVGSC
jgi:hypothetical protein